MQMWRRCWQLLKKWKECWESWEKLLLNPSSKSRRKACIVIQHWRNKWLLWTNHLLISLKGHHLVLEQFHQGLAILLCVRFAKPMITLPPPAWI
jgi:hypothetical protein